MIKIIIVSILQRDCLDLETNYFYDNLLMVVPSKQ